MLARIQLTVCFVLIGLAMAPTLIVADPPDEEWLTWTVNDCKNNSIDLSGYEDKTIYVVVFTPGNSDSCALVRGMAEYIRGHTNKADKVLGFCSDDTGCDAIKLHIRQEEWKKRVDAWNAEQEAAKQAAQQAAQPYVPPAMPDYLAQIKDEMNDAEDFDALIAHHLSFKTCQRCEQMWGWLTTKMDSPAAAPRLLKVNASGHVIQQWTSLPQNFSID